jgi:hypothetical protein
MACTIRAITLGIAVSVMSSPSDVRGMALYDQLWAAAKTCVLREDFEKLFSLQAKVPTDSLFTARLVSLLELSGRRCFNRSGSRGGEECDDIVDAALRSDRTLGIVYQRNHRRLGFAVGRLAASRDWMVWSGRWYQQSKLDGRNLPLPAPTDAVSTVRNRVGYWDEGYFVYRFALSSDSTITSLGGWDMNRKDQVRAHDSWVTFRRAQDQTYER